MSDINDTMLKFGYPDSRVAEYEHWMVLLRPQQVTLGALVVVCKGEARAYGEIGASAFAELARVIPDVESTLGGNFSYERINYLMLMMVDPHVHFHVVPRYSAVQSFMGVSFRDASWPKPPDLGQSTELGQARQTALRDKLRESWPTA